MRPSDYLEKPIAFHRAYATIADGVTGGIMLSQAAYWSKKTEDGWFWKTREAWETETGLSRYEQETARKRLRAIGVLVEREERLVHKMWYRVDFDRVDELLIALPPPRKRETHRREREKLTSGEDEKSLPSNQSEITSEITSPALRITDGDEQPEKPKSEQPQFIVDWCDRYERNIGAKYPFGPRDAQAAKKLLTNLGSAAKVMEYISKCQARTGYPFAGNVDTLPDLANNLAKFQGALTKPERNGYHGTETASARHARREAGQYGLEPGLTPTFDPGTE